jgi:hypothetical protein
MSCQRVAGIEIRDGQALPSVIDSSFETLATIMVIIARMGNAFYDYRQVRGMTIYVANVDSRDNAHVRIIHRWMTRFLVAGSMLMVGAIGCFILLLIVDHLWWTIMTNNICIITMHVLMGLYRARVTMAVKRIHADQHKVRELNLAFHRRIET